MQTIYLAMVDCGDGSGTPNWFKSKDLLTQAEQVFPEELWMGTEEYRFPEDFDFKACGITFSDQDWKERIEDGE